MDAAYPRNPCILLWLVTLSFREKDFVHPGKLQGCLFFLPWAISACLGMSAGLLKVVPQPSTEHTARSFLRRWMALSGIRFKPWPAWQLITMDREACRAAFSARTNEFVLVTRSYGKPKLCGSYGGLLSCLSAWFRRFYLGKQYLYELSADWLSNIGK